MPITQQYINTGGTMQEFLSKFWRATIEFDMLQPNDRILVGLSGGKDSTFLLKCLVAARSILPFKIEVAAVTLDPMFTDDFPVDRLQELCDSLQVEFFCERVNINAVIQEKKYKSPCFSCAYFRRAATNRVAMSNGFNKIALGHHHDDAVETFTMNILTSGQVRAFLPVTYLSRSKLHVIRPLVYFREHEVRSAIKKLGIQPLKSPCPYDGCTKREHIKELLRFFNKEADKEAYDHLGAAMRTSNDQELWPARPSRQELAAKHKNFWAMR